MFTTSLQIIPTTRILILRFDVRLVKFDCGLYHHVLLRMEERKVFRRDYLLLYVSAIIAFVVLVRLCVGLGGYSGEAKAVEVHVIQYIRRCWQASHVRRL